MTTHPRPLDHDTVAALARKHWEEEGKPEGRAIDHWLRAESELQKANDGSARQESTARRGPEPAVRSPRQENL